MLDLLAQIGESSKDTRLFIVSTMSQAVLSVGIMLKKCLKNIRRKLALFEGFKILVLV